MTFRLVQLALYTAAMAALGLSRPASAQTVTKAMLDAFTECSISAFVDNEYGLPRPDPERAFARCATEEQRILTAISFIQSDRTQRLAYALFIQRKADLKSQMVQMATR